ncbi:efflux RND transporter permease subunit [Flavobacteriaceae bacterium 14752]|uniref:efflux RND transporter permease subunit n=1 Tax=Mesohalobacter salilacus TaxID=2491711 RepID=UPI000F63FAB6|nr:efflux RND transporter permease subunit [Flavobacteriaceae bacterium 14752]
MLSYLLKRPIAVLMISFAVLLLGLASTQKLNTSLLPNIPIPEITVQVSYPNNTARQIETSITRPLRNRLMQVSSLKDIKTQTRDGMAVLNLYFQYGVSTDLAFIEVNEMVDMAMNSLPNDIERPRVIKASASDIPVVYMSITQDSIASDDQFLELSQFVNQVIKRRIEQLPDIAIADMTGHVEPEIKIIPKYNNLQSLNLSQEVLIQALRDNNFVLGNLMVQDGAYRYDFRFSNPLENVKDIEQIDLNINDRLYKFKDFAEVIKTTEVIRGNTFYNNQKAVQLAIIKQSDAGVYELKEKISQLISTFQEDYPNLSFHIHQDQSQLLKLSIDNLKTSLILGSFLAIIIMFLFLKDFKSPLIIGLSIPLSLVVSFFLMYVFGISINIISLSGLILGVGMMIDNAIIIIDNITQKLEDGKALFQACAEGTTEMISPLISSVLTTSIIFIPLVFLSGITGALFYDQAMAVSIGLFSSLLVSIFFIPVLYLLLIKNQHKSKIIKERINLSRLYKKGFKLFYMQKKLTFLIVIIFLSFGVVLALILPIKGLPDLKQSEAIIELDWNENISISENNKRVQQFFDTVPFVDLAIETGEQKYLLQREADKSLSEAEIYVKFSSVEKLQAFLKNFKAIRHAYPKIQYSIQPPENIFQYIFGQEDAQFEGQLYSTQSLEAPNLSRFDSLKTHIPFNFKPLAKQELLSIKIQHDKMLLYNVSYEKLTQELKTLLNQNYIDNLKNTDQIIPIRFGIGEDNLSRILNSTFITNNDKRWIPLNQLISVNTDLNYKIITANRGGEYLSLIPVNFINNPEKIITTTQNVFSKNSNYDIKFSGAYFENQNVLKEFIIVALVALSLLYFVMAAQFNSLLQPLIILTEIPINIGGALLLVWLFNGSLNVMTGIGIVVMAGIVINDSIIKIHTINSLRNSGLDMDEAIQKAGVMRLKPILMTSLTTILALLPFLFISGLGADLQKPLALSVIGGLFIGTFVSLYFIPVLYRLLNR